MSLHAEKMFVKGCSLNDENSCVQLSSLYRQHAETIKLKKKTDNIFQRYFQRNRFSVYSAEKMGCYFGRFEDCARLSELCKKVQ